MKLLAKNLNKLDKPKKEIKIKKSGIKTPPKTR